jgi:hypothetical protein
MCHALFQLILRQQFLWRHSVATAGQEPTQLSNQAVRPHFGAIDRCKVQEHYYYDLLRGFLRTTGNIEPTQLLA